MALWGNLFSRVELLGMVLFEEKSGSCRKTFKDKIEIF